MKKTISRMMMMDSEEAIRMNNLNLQGYENNIMLIHI